jgi:hypothetical protein
MIDGDAIVQIFSALMGCWAMGFGIGKAVAWTRKISQVA